MWEVLQPVLLFAGVSSNNCAVEPSSFFSAAAGFGQQHLGLNSLYNGIPLP